MTQSARTILLVLSLALLAPIVRAQDAELFERDVRPLLVDKCYKCHSKELGKNKGGLTLDTKAGLDGGGDNGPVLVRGDPEKSRLIEAVRWTNADLQMPPKEKLTDKQIASLVAWVKAGAPDPRIPAALGNARIRVSTSQPFDLVAARKWWAFEPVKDAPPPAVKGAAWVKSPVDAFILAKLEANGLAPAKPADKRTLIRRATFDLIGLPPTEMEVDAFLTDSSPDAFAKVVDRLLASPHYGEKWGRHWLDVVRYTDLLDARGAGNDLPDSWRYRDWVIKAFNTDLPYDQFVKTQIAGDLMPRGSDAQAFDNLVATGMYAIGNWGNGDADKEKMVTDIVDDQIDVTGRAFLGLTLACARCHDHKFDPISAADYYGLAGIFFSSHILPDVGAKTAGSEILRIPLATPADVALRRKYDERVATLTQGIDNTLTDYRTKTALASFKHLDGYLQCAWECRAKNAVAVTRYALTHDLDPATARAWADYLAPRITPPPLLRKPLKRVVAKALNTEGLAGLYPNDSRQVPNFILNRNDAAHVAGSLTIPGRSFTLHPGMDSDVAVAWTSPVTGKVKIRGKVADADTAGADGVAWRLEACTDKVARVLADGVIDNGAAAAIEGEPLDAVSVNEGDVIQLVIDPRAEYLSDTTLVELTIAEAGGSGESWDATRDLLSDRHDAWQVCEALGRRNGNVPAGSALATWLDGATAAQTSSADVARLSVAAQKTLTALADQVAAIRKAGKDPFTGDGALTSADAKVYQLITTPAGGFWNTARQDGADLPPDLREKRGAMKAELAELQKKPPAMLPSAHGIQDGGTSGSQYAALGDTRIHLRGKYDKLGDRVPRRFPVVLAGEKQPAVGDESTSSGRLQLAEWVASRDNPLTARVMANRLWQWHFGQGLVRTPSNFGKLGTPPSHPELLDYLASRFIDGGLSVKAMHRTIMLSSAYQQSSIADPATRKGDPQNLLVGRMNRRRLEAEELRDELVVSTDNLIPAMGGPPQDNLNTPRRTVYMTTVRSDRSSFRSLFDAADPTSIIDQRNESTVAPQALFLMNHPFVVGKADALAKVANQQSDLDDRGKVDWLYHRLYARPAKAAEIDVGLKAVEVEGWQGYCQILLCTNEFVFVD